MGTPETLREPCPIRIPYDAGTAFAMGAIGGSAFHFSKGLYNSPKGARFIGATQAVGLKAGRIAGSFAVWSVLFSSCDCTMVYIRKKEDPWNSIISAAATGGFLSMRRGFAASAKSAAFGAVFLGLIEGTGIALNKFSSAQQPMPVMMEDMSPPQPKSSLFGRLFGGAKEEEKIANGGSEVKILETFHDPPMPNFEYK
jgi:import inner membrane translocase subunit TIM17